MPILNAHAHVIVPQVLRVTPDESWRPHVYREHGQQGMEAGCTVPCPAQHLTNSMTMDLALAWSADGQRIAFEAQTGGHWQIFVMNRDGTGLHLLNLGATDSRSPTFVSLNRE